MRFAIFMYKKYMKNNVEYRNIITEDARRTTWRVDYQPETHSAANPLGLQPGTYTLMQLNQAEDPQLTEALCTLEPTPGLATLLAVQHLVEEQDTTNNGGTLHWYEPLEAGTLTKLLEARGTLPIAEVASLATALSEGLAYAHNAGIAHGAVNTNNVLISTYGTPKLIDMRHSADSLSESAFALAQAEDTRALARLLWRCLTGDNPAPAHERIPLPLAAEGTTDQVGYALENTLDADLPSLSVIARAFSTVQCSPINPYLSAPEDVRERMPAASPTQKNAPNQWERRHETTLFPARSATATRRKKKQRIHPKKGMMLAGATLAVALGAMGAVYLLPNPSSQVNAENTLVAAGENHTEERQILEQLINTRNNELKDQGAPDLRVRAIDRVEHTDRTITLTAQLEAPNYQPSDVDIRENGVHLQDGVAVQQVSFELTRDGQQWRIVKADPMRS